MQQLQFRQYNYRYVVYTIYIITSLVNYIPANTFSATTTLVTNLFGLSSTIVTFNFLFFPISSALAAPIINWTLTKLGIRISYYIAAALMVPGVWLRITISTENPYLCLTGSFLSSIACNFLMNSASKISTHWFKKQTKTITTFMAIVVNLISASIGLFIPGLFLNSQSTKQDFLNFLKIQAIFVTIPYILLVILIRQKPPTPPSRGAEVQHDIKMQKYRNILNKLFTNKNFLLAAVAMSLSYGLMIGYLSIFNRCLKGLQYIQISTIISKIVIFATVGGIVGNVLFSQAIKRTKKYKMIAIALQFGFFLGSLMLNVGLDYSLEQTWQLALISILIGATYNSSPSVFIVFASQLAFPVDQASVAGYMMAVGHIVGFVLGLILLPLVNQTRSNTIQIQMIIQALALIGALITLFIDEDLRFEKYQKNLLKNEDESQIQTNLTRTISQKNQEA